MQAAEVVCCPYCGERLQRRHTFRDQLTEFEINLFQVLGIRAVRELPSEQERYYYYYCRVDDWSYEDVSDIKTTWLLGKIRENSTDTNASYTDSFERNYGKNLSLTDVITQYMKGVVLMKRKTGRAGNEFRILIDFKGRLSYIVCRRKKTADGDTFLELERKAN